MIIIKREDDPFEILHTPEQKASHRRSKTCVRSHIMGQRAAALTLGWALSLVPGKALGSEHLALTLGKRERAVCRDFASPFVSLVSALRGRCVEDPCQGRPSPYSQDSSPGSNSPGKFRPYPGQGSYPAISWAGMTLLRWLDPLKPNSRFRNRLPEVRNNYFHMRTWKHMGSDDSEQMQFEKQSFLAAKRILSASFRIFHVFL